MGVKGNVTLVASQIPSFVPQSTADKILFLGRTISLFQTSNAQHGIFSLLSLSFSLLLSVPSQLRTLWQGTAFMQSLRSSGINRIKKIIRK